MRLKIKIFIIVLLLTGPVAFAQSDNDVSSVELKTCTDSELKIQFMCEKSWYMRKSDDAVLAVISREPDVTMIIAKIDSSVRFLEQITKERLKVMNQYSDGFQVENENINGKDILKVKAFSSIHPSRRLLDYYFVNNNNLYGVLFSVDPKEEIENFKYLFAEIVESLTFIN